MVFSYIHLTEISWFLSFTNKKVVISLSNSCESSKHPTEQKTAHDRAFTYSFEVCGAGMASWHSFPFRLLRLVIVLHCLKILGLVTYCIRAKWMELPYLTAGFITQFLPRFSHNGCKSHGDEIKSRFALYHVAVTISIKRKLQTVAN